MSLSSSSTSRGGIRASSAVRTGLAFTVALAGFLVLGGCTAEAQQSGIVSSTSGAADAASSGDSSPVSLPSPTGTWTPPADDAAEGPTAPVSVPTLTAALSEPVDFDTGVTVSLVGVEAVDVTAQTPGENAGPAIRVTVSVENRSDGPIDLSSAVVTLSADGGAYGVGTTAGDPRPFQGDIAPEATAEGIYVFMLDPAQDRQVDITVNYAAGEPVAVFTGRTA